jgi:PAS domain S-box-containing protein
MNLFDSFAVPVWRAGLDAKCDYFNRAWLEFTGRTLAEELGDGWVAGVHPEDLEACLHTYLKAFGDRRPFVIEYRLRRHDGGYRWVVDHGAPFNDKEGKFGGYIGSCYDTTERREAEDTLRQSEQRFSAFMDNLPGFAWMKDLEGRYLYINRQLGELEPYRDTGAIGKTDAEIWPVEIASNYQANDRAAITARKGVQAVEAYLAGGEQHHVLVSKFPILGRDGSVVMVGGAAVEVTDRIHAEQALGAQLLRYRTLMETSKDSICVLDANGDLQEANAEFLRRRGYSADEGKSLNVADWDAQWTPAELREKMSQLVGGSAVFETRHRCKDGSIFDVEVGATSVQIAGKELFFCVTRDITERKQAERARHESDERFRQIAENINEVFWIWTAAPGNAQCLYVSPAYETIWGRSCESLYAKPQSWKEALHPNDREWVLVEIASLDFEKENDLIYRVVRPDQSIRWIRDRIFPVRDERGSVIRLAGLAEDITETKTAEEALQKANRQLQGLSRRRVEMQEDERRYLSRELHDQIGQALMAAKMNLQSTRRLRKHENIVERLDDTMAILDQILQQIRQISFDLRPPLLDDLGLAPALQWALRHHAERAGLAVEFIADPELKRFDPEVETACFRVALEALTNVIRHACAQKVTVELCGDGGTLQLIVRDDGIGFDPADAANRARRDRLGLAGMDERVVVLGGRFQCNSARGHGTEVRASFPALRCEGPESETS